ncbi:hypothetical protein RE428_37210 [Marinobacter nanhaiticus D15-8W]|uniref:2-isopropylmalate synthase n=1 Tax=Marinobacter nanhaiticus D15-8W TaxID=626887 RepID=N6WZA5_9GAMM|nr:hypothetical protein [Marinobacter nanhaiticus]ENO16886.1 hypothetical protein J057_04240 [Marinobacter nanhaiticus D15-8W]BES72703.1 hypothetical protein RE428_37210 [Marinobacter nanhaiticus D15-8W]
MTTEAERQFYLSQMGVHLWYARDPLPGAAPSPDFDFSEPESEQPEPAPEVVRSAPTVKRSAEDRAAAQGNVRDLLKSIGGQSSPKELEPSLEEKSEPVPESKPVEPSLQPQIRNEAEAAVDDRLAVLDGARLDLGFWVSDRHCLVSSLSTDISEELQAQLATNILRAIGAGVSDQRRLVWPIFNNPAVMKNARKDLGYLLNRIDEDLLGDRVFVALGPLAETEQQHQALVSWLADKPVCGEHGLAALAADPRNKKYLWDLLKEQLLGGQ